MQLYYCVQYRYCNCLSHLILWNHSGGLGLMHCPTSPERMWGFWFGSLHLECVWELTEGKGRRTGHQDIFVHPWNQSLAQKKVHTSCTCSHWWQLRLKHSVVLCHSGLTSDLSRFSIRVLEYWSNYTEGLFMVYIRLPATQSQKLHLVSTSHALFRNYS